MSADACKIKAGVQSSSASFCQVAPCACNRGCPGLVGSDCMPLQCRLLCSIDVVSEHVKIAPRAPKHMTVNSLTSAFSACAAPQYSPTTVTNTCSAACTHHTPTLYAASGGARSPRGCQAGQTTTSRTTGTPSCGATCAASTEK
jgi:hypothetical protein